MGSIPALTVADLVPAIAGASVGNTAGQAGADSDGFGQVFAVQIADAGVLGSAATEVNGASLPSSVAASVALSEISPHASHDDGLVPAPPLESGIVGGGAKQVPLIDVSAPAASTWLKIPEPSVPTVALPSVRIASTADTTEVLSAPALVDAMALGLASIAPANGVGVPASAQHQVTTPLNTLEQLPRNGRPVEAQPDRASYFVALPPSPLAQTQARLVQTLSSQSVQVISTVTAPATSLKTEATQPLSLVDLLTEATLADVATQGVAKQEPPSSALPPDQGQGQGQRAAASLLTVPAKNVNEDKKATPLNADVSMAAGMVSPLSSAQISAPGVTETHIARSRSATNPHGEGAPFVASLRLSAEPTAIATVATAASAKRIIDQPADAQTLALTAVPQDEPVLTTIAVPVDATALHVRTPEPPPVSEHARMQDPLRGVEPAINSVPAATTSMASAAAIPFAIPFANPSVNGGSNTSPATLPNPLERNIARQLTQQLSGPMASLTNTGAQRKGAVDKTLIIRLTPPELGTVRIEISQRNGELTVRMHAEDPAVRQAIERMLPSLRTDLRQADSPLQHITVDSSSSGDRSSSDRNADDRGAWQGQQQQRQERGFDGGGQSHRRDGERPIFSLSGMPAPEPIAVVPRSRSLGGRSSTTGVDALA